jgi:hypothetical protein
MCRSVGEISSKNGTIRHRQILLVPGARAFPALYPPEHHELVLERLSILGLARSERAVVGTRLPLRSPQGTSLPHRHQRQMLYIEDRGHDGTMDVGSVWVEQFRLRTILLRMRVAAMRHGADRAKRDRVHVLGRRGYRKAALHESSVSYVSRENIAIRGRTGKCH